MPASLPDGETLTPEQFAKVRAIFEAAVERPEGERRAFAAGACAGDAALLREVEQMLAGEEETRALLDAPPVTPGNTPVSSAPEEGRFPAGTVLAGRYRILSMLGRGGMGEVYRAHDLILNQVVALKFLSPANFSEAALLRFRNEVRIARQVSHPNVCRVYDLGMVEGLHFLSMEYIDGEDLSSLLRRIGRLPQDKAMEFTRKICAGLGAAHERGVLHRDLKPANIMIDGRGQVRITDFGLAGLAAEIPLSDIRSGTPAYMSPEQKSGKEVTPRSDIYSLGLVLHEMFTGRQRQAGSQTSPSEFVKDLDPAIERLILRCLEDDPARRPPTALRVTMSLPGADPIAAALAAGETPSPEMVAASQEKEGFSPRTAALAVLIVVACVFVGFYYQAHYGLLALAPLNKPPDAMAERARVILSQLGLTGTGIEAYGYRCCDPAHMIQVGQLSEPAYSEALRSYRPPLAYFVYRRGDSQGEITPYLAENTITQAPADHIQMALDPASHLIYLAANSSAATAPFTGPANPLTDPGPLFQLAGLDPSRFAAIDPPEPPPVVFDQQAAWRGTYAESPRHPIVVRAASWRGHIVYLQVGDLPQISPPAGRLPVPLAAGLALLLLIPAWRNWRANRVDRRGAFILATAASALVITAAPLVPSYNPVIAGLLALGLYAATEPYARRYWPDSLVSWSRVIRGQIRNSLVASHILAGVAGGAIFAHIISPIVLRGPSPGHLTSLRIMLDLGPRFLLLGWSQGILYALTVLAIIILARLVIPRTWLADVIAILMVVALVTDPTVLGTPQGWLTLLLSLPYSVLWIVGWRRFGFLALLTMWITVVCLVGAVQTTSGWMAPYSMAVHAIPIVVSLWALWVVITTQPATAEGVG